MQLYVLAVRDRAAQVYAQPFFVLSIGSAIRSFGDEVNRDAADNNLFRHPEDFDLYKLGVYDDNTGRIESCDPEKIAIGSDYRKATE